MEQPKFVPPPHTLRVVAPAGQLKNLEPGIELWQREGYTLELPNLTAPWHYLSGNDRERFADFASSWSTYGALLGGRGGYGTMRLLPRLKELPQSCPWLIGFSDITALLWALAQERQIMSIHAPVLATCAQTTPQALGALFDLIAGKTTHLTLKGTSWRGGKVWGTLLPGNLTVATHLLGTPYMPDWDDIVLALEDVAEPPYKIDRMLTHWQLTGGLGRIKGIALGSFGEDPLLETILKERLDNLSIPIVGELPFGHTQENYPLVVGAKCLLDGDNATLTWHLDKKLG